MNNPHIISLSSLFNEKINGRSSVKVLFQQVKDNKYVIFDFTDITFISRAAAHELAVLLEDYQKRDFTISFKNVTDDVNQMLDTITESRKVDLKNATLVNRLHFKSEREMKKYLLSF